MQVNIHHFIFVVNIHLIISFVIVLNNFELEAFWSILLPFPKKLSHMTI